MSKESRPLIISRFEEWRRQKEEEKNARRIAEMNYFANRGVESMVDRAYVQAA
jgi:hypothetical protein